MLIRQIQREDAEQLPHLKFQLALYKKRGFESEGTRRDAYVVNTRYVDGYMMAKLI